MEARNHDITKEEHLYQREKHVPERVACPLCRRETNMCKCASRQGLSSSVDEEEGGSKVVVERLAGREKAMQGLAERRRKTAAEMERAKKIKNWEPLTEAERDEQRAEDAARKREFEDVLAKLSPGYYHRKPKAKESTAAKGGQTAGAQSSAQSKDGRAMALGLMQQYQRIAGKK
uniref:Uncharacterized protein n=1 Tax=Hemiselmis andersenii TaxID=464988 RepID=A0A7S1MZL7_HEMAN|mmetsp:Transcript_9956/g.24308  ORF Transcript_9956/g.24308 Transcript_9956/m.24308 type:complete len:175 (+) Transcript_9956:370-894(+)